jgi:phosphate-selective porin OprO/OprP
MRHVLVLVALTVAMHAYAADDELHESPTPDDHDRASDMGGLDSENSKNELRDKKQLGIVYISPDKRFFINPWLRGQFRFSDPFDGDPLNNEDFENVPGDGLEVRRARLKVEGYMFNPNIGFYYEHELSGDHPLLDLRLDLDLRNDIQMRIGQHKVLYNRERVDSSGKQQFAERSISTYAFTLDRQIGVTLAKGFMAGTIFDNRVMLGLNKGDGRGDLDDHGNDPMLLARWQWHFLGEDLPFSQSDLNFRQKPAASLAFATAQVRGPYTRYSSSGGGQLDGFKSGGDERYTLQQFLQEFTLQFNGLSIQQEYHIKKIEDHEAGTRSTLQGGYAQLGKLWPVSWHDKSFAVEGAVRIARVDWDTVDPDRVQDELTLATNLFLNGHNNKITADISRIYLKNDLTGKDEDVRFRLQWDVSF